MKPGVLVIEDDAKSAELIRLYLERDGYPVMVARDGRQAIDFARRFEPAVALIDVMLPEIDGMEVCRVLRNESEMGLILVTARVAESDVLQALDLGADDYITKPFRPRELVARVRAVLRRRGAERNEQGTLSYGELLIDPRRHEVRVSGENANVTPREFQLLISLAKEPGRAFTRLELLERAFGYTYEGLERTVDAHIRNLRRKIEPDADRPTYIETVYGVGYRFAESVESPTGVA